MSEPVQDYNQAKGVDFGGYSPPQCSDETINPFDVVDNPYYYYKNWRKEMLFMVSIELLSATNFS